LQNYLAHYQKARQLLVHESDWQDPMHVATDMVQTDPTQFATEFANAVSPSYSEGWVKRWFAVAEATRTTIVERLRQIDELFEGKIFTELSALIPSKANLFAGNSMPVRDLDAFYPSSSQDIHFIGNRGASGIDGVVSSSLGVSAVAKEPTVSVLGDVSFYHDMNGLLAAKLYGLHATFIVVNNNGGGIFSFLPQREYPETFEKYFATPHGLTFQSAASLYSLSYSKADSWNEFRGSVSKSIGLPGTAIVELHTERVRNFQLHRDMSASATKAAETKLTELT
jgi:2-succinyl-5-enolpyruvyl-6-hydroxy-3-cyclohexene-1-carboxylate synthase